VTGHCQHIVALVEEETSGYACEQNENKLFPKGVPVMIISSYAARAKLYHLWQQHADWQHARFAAALGSSPGWVKKWLKRLREELAQGVPLGQICQGHSRARQSPPTKTHPVVIEQILAILCWLVLATSDIRSNIRKATADKKRSRHVLHVETTRKSNALRHQ
jgi:hypothetical protein